MRRVRVARLTSAPHLALLALLVVALLAAGCASPFAGAIEEDLRESVAGSAPSAAQPTNAPAAAPMAPEGGRGTYGDAYANQQSLDDAAAQGRMIIRTANLTIVVKDSAQTMDDLVALARSFDGYVAASNRWYSADQLYGEMTIRVPAERLDEVLAAIRDQALRVENENIGSEDVTEEYADVDARLRNLEATEQELLALLTEVRENRGEAEEILAIHRELTTIRGQIESLQGRKNYLERMTALSTITLSVRPEAAPRPVTDEPWNPLVTASNAARALVSVAKGFVSLLIYLVVLSPLVLIPVGALWLLARALRARKRRRETAAS